jgi:hypothetical protein
LDAQSVTTEIIQSLSRPTKLGFRKPNLLSIDGLETLGRLADEAVEHAYPKIQFNGAGCCAD